MKRYILGFIICAYCITGYSQTDSIQAFMYCEIVGFPWFGDKVNVSIDFGQKKSFWKPYEYLKDKDGKAVVFNSMIYAMNYMGLDGWEFIQAYVVACDNQNITHWILRKRIDILNEKQKQEAIRRLQNTSKQDEDAGEAQPVKKESGKTKK